MLEISIREILQQELNKRSYITQSTLSVEDLFHCRGIKEWTWSLFSSQKMEVLDRRIDEADPLRLLHAVSTFLLGIALREGAGINCSSLPRIFSTSVAGGDAFSFFWSGICLCHDLGFEYEIRTGSAQRAKALSPEGRLELLGLEYDLLSLKRAEYPPELTKEEADWVEETLQLADHYNQYRLLGINPAYQRVDHGVAGAEVFYDALQRQAAADPFRRPASGELAVNARHSRFHACCLLIACTIARHNMWIATPKDVSAYMRFNLQSLCPGPELKQVDSKKPEEQMLFLLDFMDTIDPVKNLYVRAAEERPEAHEELSRRRNFLLDRVNFSFDWEQQLDYRWAQFLPHHQITLSAAPSTGEEKNWLADYLPHLKGLSEWLDTKKPSIFPTKAVFYYPREYGPKHVGPGGITDKEIDSICLYGGSSIAGKPGRFYQLQNAYQTFNLLMMEGLDGELTRVCTEKQNPDDIYIRDWRRTLEVFTDIFQAQCRYREFAQQKRVCLPQQLYRTDRKLNVEQMGKLGRTFAFTSISKAGYLPDFAARKQNPALLEIALDSSCPYLDLAAVLKDDYVYTREAEILLPPFIQAEVSGGNRLTEEQLNEYGLPADKPVFIYQVSFGGFCEEESREDPYVLIQRLEQNCDSAAKVLKKIRKNRSWSGLTDEELKRYTEWKKSFSQLAYTCFCRIWTDACRNSRKDW